MSYVIQNASGFTLTWDADGDPFTYIASTMQDVTAMLRVLSVIGGGVVVTNVRLEVQTQWPGFPPTVTVYLLTLPFSY